MCQKIAREVGRRAVYIDTDVTREADFKAVVALAVGELGRHDCMINNSGSAGMFAPIRDVPVDAFDRTTGLFLRAAFIGTKCAAPVMKALGSGIIQLSRTAAMELGESHIRVNCISPGFVITRASPRRRDGWPTMNRAS